MTKLRSLTEELEPGAYLAWVGSKADVGDRVYPKQVTNIEQDGGQIRVEAEGVRGGSYFYRLDEDGTGEAFFENPRKSKPTTMGEVIFAELTNSKGPVMVKRGCHDSR